MATISARHDSGESGRVATTPAAQLEFLETRRLLSAVPAPLLSVDIGTPAGGSATYAADTKTFSVVGAGSDLFGAADAFHFVYQPLIGNGSVTVRVAANNANDPHALAGLDIRSSLSPSAANLFLSTRGDGSVFVNDRTTDGIAGGNLEPGQAGTIGEFLRITRSGSNISASRSSDGVTFTPIAEGIIALPAKAFVGIAVASQTAPISLATAKFDRFVVLRGDSLDEQNLQLDLNAIVTDADAALKSALTNAKVLSTDLNRTKASVSNKALLNTFTKDARTMLGKLKADIRTLRGVLAKDSKAIASDARLLLKNPASSAAQSKLNADIAKLQADDAGRQPVAAEAFAADGAAQTDLSALAAANAADGQTSADINTASADSARTPVTITTDLNAIAAIDAAIVADVGG